MNNGLIIGQAIYDGQPASDVIVRLLRIEGTSEMNVGRGVQGQQGSIRLYMPNEVPADGRQITTTTNNGGSFALAFKWDFLSGGGIPNDTNPFYHVQATRFTGGLVPQSAGVTTARLRGIIMNSPTTFAELIGANVPIGCQGQVAWGLDIAALLRNVNVPTLPFNLTGRAVMESQMFFGVWAFEAM